MFARAILFWVSATCASAMSLMAFSVSAMPFNYIGIVMICMIKVGRKVGGCFTFNSPK